MVDPLTAARPVRSQDALTYRKLYKTRAWRIIRGAQLQIHPFCEWCAERGEPAVAAVDVHHKIPHKGDQILFRDPQNLVSLCVTCHASEAQQAERLGYSIRKGADGYPIDPLHPANR